MSTFEVLPTLYTILGMLRNVLGGIFLESEIPPPHTKKKQLKGQANGKAVLTAFPSCDSYSKRYWAKYNFRLKYIVSTVLLLSKNFFFLYS